MTGGLPPLRAVTDGQEGELLAAVAGVTVTRKLSGQGTATVTLELRDPSRELVAGPLLAAGARVELADLTWELVSVDRRGRGLSTVWQDLVSLTLQRQDDTEVTRPDTTDPRRFAASLIREGGVDAQLEPGRWRLDDDEDDEQLARTGDDDEGDPESSWDALERLGGMLDPTRVRYSLGDRVVMGSPSWLADGHALDPSGSDPFRWAEGRGGVDSLDYRWDVGKRADSATASVWVPNLDRVPPGAAVRLDEPGAASDGTWLVESVRWQPTTRRASVDLTRPAELR